MKRILLFCAVVVMVLLCRTPPASAAMSYGLSHYVQNRGYLGSGGTNDPLYNFINEVETSLDGTTGVASIIFTPGTAPTVSEGKLYYDLASHGLVLYNGTSWVSVDTAGASSLDTAYNNGVAITVDAGSIVLTATNAADNTALTIAQADTGTSKGFVITNAGTGNSIDIQGQSSAKDIEGTGDLWSVSTAGVGTFAGLVAGASDVTLENGEIIDNGTDDMILINTGDEDLLLDFTTGANTITLGSNSTGGTTIALGDYSTISGIVALTGVAADFTISTTGDATGEDLIISQDGTGDNQVIIQSAGSAANAIAIQSAKGIDIDSVDDMAITNTATTTADDFVITQAGGVDASLILTSEGTGTDALSLITTNASGDIKINSGDMLDIDAADDITIDLAGAAGEDITITNTGGSIQVVATEADQAAIVLSATAGGINIGTVATYDIAATATGGKILLIANENAAGTITLATTGGGGTSEAILLSNDTGASVTEGAAAIELVAAAGGVELRSTANLANAISLTSDGGTTGTIQIYNDQGTSTTEKAASIQLLSDVGGIELWSGLNAADAVNIMVDGDTSSGITIFNDTGTGAASIYLLTDLGGITGTATAGPIVLTAGDAAAGDMTLTVADEFILDVTGGVSVDSAEEAADAIGLVASGTAGGITLNAGTAGITFSGDIIKNFILDVEVEPSTSETVLTGDSGKVFCTTAAQGAVTYTLPAAAAGLTFTFVDVSATEGDDLILQAVGDDTINGGTAAKKYSSDQADAIPCSVTITAVSATQWVITAQVGDACWANDNS